MVITWLDSGAVFKNWYFGKFSFKISDVFFQGQTLFWPYLRNGRSDWCETKHVTLTFDLTRDLDLGSFEVKFWNSCISGIVGLIDMKWKGSELIWYWADCMTLPLDHTHDLDLGVSRSESEIAISQEWGGRLTWNEKDVSHQFMTMMLTSVTMMWWADVPDSERGDFRRRRAVDISSWRLWTVISSWISRVFARDWCWCHLLIRHLFGMQTWSGTLVGSWKSF